MATKKDFPRTLYRRAEDGKYKFTSSGVAVRYDSLLVNNQKELETGVEMGYIDDFAEALYGDQEEGLDPMEEAGDEGF